MGWYDPLRSVSSRGSQAERPGSLAGLAEARRKHLGQFFTPDAVARFMWQLAKPAMDAALLKRSYKAISVLDNSVGTGRLLQYAEPEVHLIHGVDVDGEALSVLGKVAQEAGFNCEFATCGMESARPYGFDVGIINPPFSVHLESPLLDASFPCTCYGKFGPNTSAVSHAYALAQAVDACQLVVALLPSTFAEEVYANPGLYVTEDGANRMRAIIELPPKLFREENTDVAVSLLVFGHGKGVRRIKVASLDDVPALPVALYGDGKHAKLSVRGIEDDGPAITRPVTGDNTVRVSHAGRKIGLKFKCGLTEAKVLNAIMVQRVAENGPTEMRRPKGVVYSGQGVLDIEVHLAQGDPQESFKSFLSTIEGAGGKPVVDIGLLHFLRKRQRQTQRQAKPLRHTVWVPEGVAGNDEVVTGRARKMLIADPKVWGSPVIQPGQELTFTRAGENYSFELAGRQFGITPEDLYVQFEVQVGAMQSGWHVVHEGLQVAFPDMAEQLTKRARALGIDKWLNWGFQFDDMIELCMKPYGSIAAWDMGLGKARLGSALITLVGCKHGLIVTEAGLIDEMVIEMKGLPFAQDEWQVITSPAQLRNLRRINIISYERLRMPICQAHRKETYAKRLRHRCGVLVADEGDVLANPTSDQSRALWQLSPKRRFILTGTPIANYPRDVLPLIAFANGDGTAAQPWGWRRGYLEQNWRNSMSFARRGIDEFVEKFVTFEWVTREFEDTLVEGAKREIPRIANLELFRQLVAPCIKRRILEEPEVAAHIKIPKHSESIVEVDWDPAHLSFYLKVAEEFANWYAQSRKDRSMRNNLIVLLARIRAVSFASDYPQHGVEGFGGFHQLTSKQRWVIEEVKRLTAEGKKTIVYAENPGQLDMIGRHLNDAGIDNVVFHGKKPIKQRTRELNEEFRYGPNPNLLASHGVTQKGLNLWQASEIIGISRSWSATTESQAIKRALRPQQTKNVRVRWVHLRGGIDEYKAQLVRFKKNCAQAGLDWGTPESSDVEFLHLTTVIGRFCDELSALRNIPRQELRKSLELEAAYG